MILAAIGVIGLGIAVIVMRPYLVAPWRVNSITVQREASEWHNGSVDYLRQPVVIDGQLEKYLVCGLLALSSQKNYSMNCPFEIRLTFAWDDGTTAILIGTDDCPSLSTPEPHPQKVYYRFYGKRLLFDLLGRHGVRELGEVRRNGG